MSVLKMERNQMPKFDLNVEKILENWEPYHAVREILANALDEHVLTKNSQDLQILKEGDDWIIRDFGRGLKYTHLTQNESDEKHRHPQVIGMFGIGLKDALATFNRRGIEVQIDSKHSCITTDLAPKEGFEDISTLHAFVYPPEDSRFVGTRFILKGLADEDLEKAKAMFLSFSEAKILDATPKGQVIQRQGNVGIIYVNGVQVAEETNFLFSYNITSMSTGLRKAMNRERSNVGRTAYTDLIKKILVTSKAPTVMETIAQEFPGLNLGTPRDELAWFEVQRHAVKILNQTGKYLFLSAEQAMGFPAVVDDAKVRGLIIITVPEILAKSLKRLIDGAGQPVCDLDTFIHAYNESFQFEFLEPETLTAKERRIHALTPKIIQLTGGNPKQVQAIRISAIMRRDSWEESRTTLGCWDPQTKSIVVARDALSSVEKYAGILIHEIVHAKTGFPDVDRNFEDRLTQQIGRLCDKLLSSH